MCQGSYTPRPSLSEDTLHSERQRLRRLLREHGYTITAPRLAMYAVLLDTNDHICAEHILDAIKRDHPAWRVNKTTVYRTLDLFQSLGLIYEMKRDDGRAQYELALHGPHGHLLCSVCGELQDLAPATASAWQSELESRYGFRVDLSHHALLGVCSACAQNPSG